MVLSVIIPALDEAAVLRAALLPQLLAQTDVELEILVAPADSTDATGQLPDSFPVHLVASERGRGHQMNAAARRATGEHFLFLHADSQLASPTLLRDALAAMTGRPRGAGHFPLRFVGGKARFVYGYLTAKTLLNRHETINGDQGMLLPGDFFWELGGFPERFEFLEDQLFAARVFEHGAWVLLPGELYTSTRRFAREGMFRRTAATAIIMAMHHCRFEEFFAEIPALYRPQKESGRFDFLAFSDALEELFNRLGTTRTRGVHRAAGAYVRENAWQLAHLLDVFLRQPPPGPSLRCYDKRIAVLLDRPLVDRTATALMMTWYRLTRAWFRATDPGRHTQ